jgi:exonuclease III
VTGSNNHRVIAKLEILSLNVRSLNKNKEAVAAVLETERPDVLALQETWLMKPPPNLHADYDRVSSLPKKNEGVAMYFRKGLQLRSALDHEWSSNILVMANK